MADYCTAAKVRAAGRLNIEADDYDAELTELCTAASRWIDAAFAGGIADAFAASASAERSFGPEALGGGTLFLDAPLLSISGLRNGDGAAISPAETRLLPLNSTSHRMLELKSSAGWAFFPDGLIKVTGVWGLYAAGSTPAPVEEAATMLAAWMFKRYQAALADATAVVELGQLMYAEAMPKHVVALLRPYNAVSVF